MVSSACVHHHLKYCPWYLLPFNEVDHHCNSLEPWMPNSGTLHLLSSIIFSRRELTRHGKWKTGETIGKGRCWDETTSCITITCECNAIESKLVFFFFNTGFGYAQKYVAVGVICVFHQHVTAVASCLQGDIQRTSDQYIFPVFYLVNILNVAMLHFKCKILKHIKLKNWPQEC